MRTGARKVLAFAGHGTMPDARPDGWDGAVVAVKWLLTSAFGSFSFRHALSVFCPSVVTTVSWLLHEQLHSQVCRRLDHAALAPQVA
jgi:hypothetical protein